MKPFLRVGKNHNGNLENLYKFVDFANQYSLVEGVVVEVYGNCYADEKKQEQHTKIDIVDLFSLRKLTKKKIVCQLFDALLFDDIKDYCDYFYVNSIDALEYQQLIDKIVNNKKPAIVSLAGLDEAQIAQTVKNFDGVEVIYDFGNLAKRPDAQDVNYHRILDSIALFYKLGLQPKFSYSVKLPIDLIPYVMQIYNLEYCILPIDITGNGYEKLTSFTKEQITDIIQNLSMLEKMFSCGCVVSPADVSEQKYHKRNENGLLP